MLMQDKQMFREIDKQFLKYSEEDIGFEKRWFRDAERECDIFVWQDNKQIIRFQFWYNDFLLEWDRTKGIKTGKIDASTGSFHSYQTPIFRYHDNFDKEIYNSVQQLLSGELKQELPNSIFNSLMLEIEGKI